MRSVLLLVGLCSTAAAAPIATLTKDVDGDSSDDKVEVDASGELRIETKRGASKLALPIRATKATLSAAIARGTPTIIVQTSDEAIAVQLAGSTWKQVVKTKVGGVGLDADYSVVLDANADGVFRHQSRPGYARCDGKPALLFAERLEHGKFVPSPKLPLMLPDVVPVIAAHLDPTPPASEPMLFKARVASHQVGAPDAGALGQPTELDDGKPTVWREELAGAGEGHFFTFKARTRGSTAAQIRIVPARIKGANRPQRIALVSAQGAWRIELPDAVKEPAGTGYVADLPAPIADCVTLVIESTYGTTGATAFAELEVFGEGERSGGGDASLAQVIASGGDGAKAAARALAHRGSAGAAAIEAELAKTKDAAARGRLVRALIENRDPTAGPVLARAVAEDWVHDADLIAALAALGGLGQGQALHDVAARQAVPLPARVAAVSALAPSVDKERELLVALAGRGPRELRQAVIERLTAVQVATLVPLAEAQPKAAAAGDLWRAITRAAHARRANAAELDAARAALTAALAKAKDYERRYRIVDGIAAVGDAAALHALAATLKQWPADAETAAIKQVAARSIAVNPRAEALDLITAFAVDADPGVRLAALSTIATAAGGTAGPWHGASGPDAIDRVIQTRLATDTWPEVRRYAAQVLGGRCSRPGPAASLGDSIARDPDVGVRGDALAALVECKAATAPALLAKMWDDSKAPLELRQRAIDLTVVLGDMTLGKKLVAKYGKWRSAAIDSEAALALTQSAAYALGRLRVPGAAEALTAALDDNAFPEIVSSAAASLGLLGPACPASVRPKLKSLSRSEDTQVQPAAARAYEICGK